MTSIVGYQPSSPSNKDHSRVSNLNISSNGSNFNIMSGKSHGSVQNISGHQEKSTGPPVTANDLKQYKILLQKLHQNQISKITYKSEADIEFLEYVRDYMQKRSELEMHHAKNLEKLSKSFTGKKFRKYLGSTNAPLCYPNSTEKVYREASGTDVSSGSSDHQEVNKAITSASPDSPPPHIRQVYKVFMKLLEQSEFQAKKRIIMGSGIEDSISKVLKEFHKLKASLTKKNMEFGVKYQQEIWSAFDELERARALYDKAAKDADAAHKKFQDSLMKPKGFTALKNMVTGKDAVSISEELNNKHKLKVRILNNARNNYLLALAGVNSLQKLYDQDDLPQLMEKVDGFFYDILGGAIDKYTEFECTLSNEISTSVNKIRDESDLISRDADIQQFLEQYASIFKPSVIFPFENVGLDEEKELIADEFTKVDLGRKLGELIAIDNILVGVQDTKEKELKGAEKLVEINTDTAPQAGHAVSPIELKQDIQNSLDLIKCQRTRLLQQMKMIKTFHVTAIMPEKAENSPGGKRFATVVAPHTSNEKTELTTVEGEELEIIIDLTRSLPEGWTFVKNKDGKTGNVPTTSIEEVYKAPPKSLAESRIVVALYDYKATDENELSFSAGDEIECAARVNIDCDDWEGKLLRTGEVGYFPKLLTKGWEGVAASAAKDMASLARVASVSKRSSLIAVQKKNRSKSFSDAGKMNSVQSFGSQLPRSPSTIPEGTNMIDPLLNVLVAKMAKVGEMKEEDEEDEEVEDANFSAVALYSYEATCVGELTIEAGETITAIYMDTGNDQWWTGTGKNGTGQFPASYVKKNGAMKKLNQKVRALYDFTPASPGEIGFKAGDILNLQQSDDPDWWDGELNGEVGAFPAAYVEKI